MGIGPFDPPVKEFFKNCQRGQRYGRKRDRRLGLNVRQSNVILTISTKAALAHSRVHKSSSLKLVVAPHIMGHISGQKNQILTYRGCPAGHRRAPKREKNAILLQSWLIKTTPGAQNAKKLVSLLGIGPFDPPVKEFFKNSQRGQRYRRKCDRRPGLNA